MASALTLVVFAAPFLAGFVYFDTFDTVSLQEWPQLLARLLLALVVILAFACPGRLLVVSLAYLSAAVLFPRRHRGKDLLWRLWLAVWAAGAALSLALIPWSDGGVMDLIARFAGLIGPALFQVAQGSFDDPFPSQIGPNAAIFACIGWLIGGVLSKQARRFSAEQAQDVR